jgi:ribose-phosphate pyrophosphokinase
MSVKPFKLFALSGSQDLAQEVAGSLGLSLGALFTTRFSDGEVYARFDETIRGETVVLIAQINLPYHHLFELLVVADAARRSSAKEVVAVLPYLPHSRQERRDGERTAVTSRLMAETIERAGVNRVLTLDLHSMSIEGFFKIPIDHLQMSGEFVKDIRERYAGKPLMVCSPDFGGIKRIRAYKQALDCDMAVIHKERLKPNVVERMEIIGDPAGKHVVLIDDMTDTGGTLVAAAHLLLQQGALTVRAYCTHGVLSGDAVEKINTSDLEELVFTNSISHRPEGPKFRVLSCAPLMAKALDNLSRNQSIKTLNSI